jgi:hypothetical protein
MNRNARAVALFDARRLGFDAVLAALVVSIDFAVLGLIGIESMSEGMVQFVTITVGAYAGLIVVDVALDDTQSDDDDDEEED